MITVNSRDGMYRAEVDEDNDGVVTRYYRWRGDWHFDRECRPALPFHAALDHAHRMVDGE